MKLSSWKEARMAAKALQAWLCTHCPSCGKRHSQADLDGGRCLACGRSLAAVATLAEAVKEASDRIEAR